MSAWSSVIRTLTIPQDAGPNDPRVVITGNPLDVGIGVPMAAAILFFWNETDFYFLGVNDLGPNLGLLILGAQAPSVSEGHVFAELNVSTGGAFQALLQLFARDEGAANNSTVIDMGGTMSLDGGDLLTLRGDNYVMNVGVDDVSMSRGMEDVETAGTTGGITTVETVVETLLDVVGELNLGRRYRVEYHGNVASTVAGDQFRVRIRQQNATGTTERDCGEYTCFTANIPVPVDVTCLYTGRQVVGEQVVLTVVRTAGTGTLTYTSDSAMLTDETTTSLT